MGRSRGLKGLWGRPWCVGGDFNVLRSPHEHSMERRLSQAMRRFSQVIDDLDLKDLPTKGGHFTLSGGLNGQRKARLDIFLINDEWDNLLSNVIQIMLPKLISDHFLEGGRCMVKGPSPYRFEYMWLKEEGFKTLIKECG